MPFGFDRPSLSGVDVEKYKRLFPFAVSARKCEDCSTMTRPVYMEEDYVRDPYTQKHFRGVLAWVCPECEKKVRKEQPGSDRPGWSE